MTVRFAKGLLFTRHCPSCGFENGGRITNSPEPPEESGICVMCGKETEWKLIGTMEHEGAETEAEDEKAAKISPNA